MTDLAVTIKRKLSLMQSLSYNFEQLSKDNVAIRNAMQTCILEKLPVEYGWLIAAVTLAEENRRLRESVQMHIEIGEARFND